MLNNTDNANALIMRRLPNPNRPTIKELEDLLIEYADKCCGDKRKRTRRSAIDDPYFTDNQSNTL